MSETSQAQAPLATATTGEPALTDHAYDGIQEFDNPTPGWWSWVFIGTIVFSVLYLAFMSLTGGHFSPVGFYDRAKIAEAKAGGILKGDAATLIQLSKDEDSLRAGASVFATNCMSCHAKDGSGQTGPNLTDEKYIYVTKIEDMIDVVTKGRNNGAMPPWGNRLSPNEIVQVSAYAASLRGQNKPGRPAEPNAKTISPWSQ